MFLWTCVDREMDVLLWTCVDRQGEMGVLQWTERELDVLLWSDVDRQGVRRVTVDSHGEGLLWT